MSNREPSLVAAIDFGTMYSGYAFSVRESFQKDPLSINVNQVWNAGGHQLFSVKTPTTLLLDSNKQLVAFGYQAENRYTELVLDGKLDDHYYFHRFKMKLYENEVRLTLFFKFINAVKPIVTVFPRCHMHICLFDGV